MTSCKREYCVIKKILLIWILVFGFRSVLVPPGLMETTFWVRQWATSVWTQLSKKLKKLELAGLWPKVCCFFCQHLFRIEPFWNSWLLFNPGYGTWLLSKLSLKHRCLYRGQHIQTPPLFLILLDQLNQLLEQILWRWQLREPMETPLYWIWLQQLQLLERYVYSDFFKEN